MADEGWSNPDNHEPMSSRPRPMYEPPIPAPRTSYLDDAGHGQAEAGQARITVTVPGLPPIQLRAALDEDASVEQDGVRVEVVW